MLGSQIFNAVMTALFLVCYAYQLFYIPVSLFGRVLDRRKKWDILVQDTNMAVGSDSSGNKVAVLICARNEEEVIGELIKSIRQQDYPAELIKIFVAADNCTDKTADIARAHGAYVWERFSSDKIGKGYALQFLLEKIDLAIGLDSFDSFLVLDADNLLEENFITEISKTFASGYDIVTSYRNSKNYGDNWISAGYSLWFLRESRFLNDARMRLGTSCAVSGTGFMFSREVLRACDGWNFHLLTEDIEFSVKNILDGRKIGYCRTAVLYDEQPVTLKQSWHQRLRWAKGYLQVFGKYGKELVSGIGRSEFACFDMTMAIMPAILLTLVGSIVNYFTTMAALAAGESATVIAMAAVSNILRVYGGLWLIGAITTVSEWRSIHASTAQKIIYSFTFPLFMLTYIPISITAIFRRVEWKPITHKKAVNLAQLRRNA